MPADNRIPVWTLQGAQNAVPWVRMLLRSMRETACRVAHMRRVADKTGREELELEQEKLADLCREVASVGFYFIDNPARGIALFPSYIQQKGRDPLAILFVYYDTRMAIGSFVVQRELALTGDLLSSERPIPAAWRRGGRRKTG